MMNRRKKIYLAVIGLGLCALMADRMMSGSAPSPASGAALITSKTAAAKSAGSGVDDRWLVAVLPFPQRDALQTTFPPVRDPFALSEAVRAALLPPPPPPPVEEVQKPVEPVAVFAASFPQRHTLSAVLMLESTRMAVVDDLSIQVGQRIEACELARIEARSVVFACPDGEAVLALAPPLTRAPGGAETASESPAEPAAVPEKHP